MLVFNRFVIIIELAQLWVAFSDDYFKHKLLKHILAHKKYHILQWGAFALFFAYFWHAYNLFTDLPAYGDALEVVWGILWYNNALIERVNPFYYPLIFHPEGWQLGILAHTPFLFLIAQPFYLIGGEVFAYNLIAIIPFFISYIGSHRFFKHYSKSPLIIIAVSLAYTFVAMRSHRALGHLHILWATSFLPFLGDALLNWKNKATDKLWQAEAAWSGFYWGLMISFSLYSVFLAPIIFLLLGRKLFQKRTIIQILFAGGIALLVGSSALLPYYLATRHEPINPPIMHALTFWSASINSLFIPSVIHSVPSIKTFANTLLLSGGAEARIQNMGLSTALIIIVGLFYGWRRPQKGYGHWLVLIAGIFLALGPVLKVNNNIIQSGWFTSFNDFLWQMGHLLKPGIFTTAEAPQEYLNSIPLPGYLFLVFVPFWEGARATARFIFVAFLGVLGVVAVSLEPMPKWLQYGLMCIWLVEMLPVQTGGQRLVFDSLHPAHEWLISQDLSPDEGVLDLDEHVLHSPSALYLSWQTKIPTASAIGSFRPQQNQQLFDQVWDWSRKSPSYLVKVFDAYQIRYLVIHNEDGKGDALWNYTKAAPDDFLLIGCFEPPADYVSPWSYPICVAELKSHSTVTNVFPIYGLSEPESWGMWSIEDRPRFNFLATAKKPYLVQAEVFPHCIEDRFQSLKLVYHEQTIYEYQWNDCEPHNFQAILPAENTEIGFNEAHFEFEYAKSPADLGAGSDPRSLSVGFSRLEILPID